MNDSNGGTFGYFYDNMYSGWQSTSSSADVGSHFITDVVIECTPEDINHPGPTTVDVVIFSPDREAGEALVLEKISSLEWRHKNRTKMMDEITFFATWDQTGDFASIHITKVELEEFIASGDSNNVQREFTLQGDDLGFKLGLKFGVFWDPPDDDLMRVHQIKENLRYGIGVVKEPEKIFTMVMDLSDDIPEKPRYLYAYGDFFWKRSAHSKDIDNCILAYSLAVQLTPQDYTDADMSYRLNNLGTSLLDRFGRSGDFADISESISSLQKAVQHTPKGHEYMAGHLNNLGNSYACRFKHQGDLADISEAISCHRKAVDLTPPGREDLHGWLSNLGSSYQRLFKYTGDLADISEAISCQEKAVSLTPQGHEYMHGHLNNLGYSFRSRFQHTGDLGDLSESISCHQKAVDLTSHGHPNIHIYLNNLENSVKERFDHTGDPIDLSEAILHFQKAVHLAPQGHPAMPTYLINLGTSYSCKGDLINISEAVSCHRKAVYLTPKGHGNMPIYLDCLGRSLRDRFECTRDLADLSEGISTQQNAILLTPHGHTDMPVYLNNLGGSFQIRFKCTGELTDISDAISCHQKSVNLTPQGHFNKNRFIDGLGTSYVARFEKTGDLDDLSEAIVCFQKSVDLTPEGHTTMSACMKHLGNSLLTRFFRGKDPTDFRAAMSNYSRAAICSTGPPSIKMQNALLWAKWSQKYTPEESLKAYKTAILLVSQVAGLEHTIEKRHTSLLDVSNLASSAAACALKLERPDLALEWLEQGRCLVWSQLNNLRTPLDALFARNPTIADNMLRISRALESAGSRANLSSPLDKFTMERKMSLEGEVVSHIKLAQEWNQLLENIRAIPQFEDFLQPPTCSNLFRHLPDSGPVVVINVHEDSCDALALISGSDEPLHIPLTKFSYAQANDLRDKLNNYLRSAQLRMRGSELDETVTRGGRPNRNDSVIKVILHQLWILVVKPILDGLGFSVQPPSSLPRIWWCATGPLAFLPIHAAGIYATSTTEAGSTLSDYAISSYIPTVRALSERVNSPRAVDEKKTALFMISQPETPNMPRIPGTTKEVHAIKKLLQRHNLRVLCLEREAATVDQGIANMETHSCIHFACHASQNTLEPLKSKFMLQDGDLELSGIIKKNLVGADLAYLSACQTSAGDEKLSEEAVHLAAGMLAAGYRGVVATMWSISDQHGPQVAEDFYSSLITPGALKSEGFSSLSSDDAARALHYATQKLRKQLGDEPSSLLVWIPYVHFGL